MNELELFKKQTEIQGEIQSRIQNEATEGQIKMNAFGMREQLAETQAAVIAQTNPAKALKVLINSYRGIMEDADGNIEDFGEAILNTYGISKIQTLMAPILNDPIRFGDISAERVSRLTEQYAWDITANIGLNWRDYGIKDPTVRGILVTQLIMITLITLSRSEDGGEKNFLSRVILESVGGGGQRPKTKESKWSKYFKI